MKLYKSIFQESWEITRRHPLLWFFGICVFFWGGKGIELEQFFTNADLLRSDLSPLRPTFWSGRQWMVIVDLFNGDQVWIAGFAVIVALFLLIAFVLIMSAHIGLIDAYGQFDANTHGRYKTHHALTAIKQHFWGVASVQLVTKAVSYGLLALAALPLFFDQLGQWQIVYSFLLFFIVTPVAVYLSTVAKFAMNDVVINKTPWVAALTRGRVLVRAQFGVILEFLVFVYIVYVIATALAVVLTQLVSLPILFAAAGDSVMIWGMNGYVFYSTFYHSVGALILMIVVALFSSWHMGSWTLFYRELLAGRKSSVTKQFWNRAPKQ